MPNITTDFDSYYSGLNDIGEKRKQVPAGTFKVTVDSLATSSSDKSGARIAKLEYSIKEVLEL